MVGTNYMGGKRNAARVRTKDTASRAQKQHFQRQKLQIMAHGLQPGSKRAPSIGKAQVPGVGMKVTADEIELAHAHAQPPPPQVSGPWSFAPTLGLDVPRTPPRKQRQPSRSRERATEHARSSSSVKSKILDALDTSEPASFRNLRNRVLALPDLAGLSQSAYPEPQTPPKSKKRPRSPAPMSAVEDVAAREGSVHAEPKTKRVRPVEEPSPFLHHFTPLDGFDTTSEDDCPEPEDDAGEVQQEYENYQPHSPPTFTSPAMSASSTASSSTCFAIDPEYSIEHRVARSFSQPRPSQSNWDNDSEIPIVVSLSAGDTAIGDNLYNYLDPWRVVGAVLGFESMQESDEGEQEDVKDMVVELDANGQLPPMDEEHDIRWSLSPLGSPQNQPRLSPTASDCDQLSPYYSPVSYIHDALRGSHSPLATNVPFFDSVYEDPMVPAQPERPEIPIFSPRSQIRTRIPIPTLVATPQRAREQDHFQHLRTPLVPSARTLNRTPPPRHPPTPAKCSELENAPDSDPESDKENRFSTPNTSVSTVPRSGFLSSATRPRRRAAMSSPLLQIRRARVLETEDHILGGDNNFDDGAPQNRLSFSTIRRPVATEPPQQSSPLQPPLFSLSRHSSPPPRSAPLRTHFLVAAQREGPALSPTFPPAKPKFDKFPTADALRPPNVHGPTTTLSPAFSLQSNAVLPTMQSLFVRRSSPTNAQNEMEAAAEVGGDGDVAPKSSGPKYFEMQLFDDDENMAESDG
ncbi:hypothetical protein MKEN_00318100 [Mycena kentingensis (nom. inval.)]|nr:hypothetical protein MKEN_00318100 [Mycena kentingensis (nom. inval.)]